MADAEAPSDRVLAEGDHHQGGQQRAQRIAGIPAYLEDRLRQPLAAARSQLGHTRRLGMEDRRSPSDQADRQEDPHKPRSHGEQQQPHQREAHAHGERIGLRMAVGMQPDKGLQDGRSHLEDQRDESDLSERKAELLLEQRIDGRDDRLHHVVEQVRRASHQQDRIDRPLRRLAQRSILHRPAAGKDRISEFHTHSFGDRSAKVTPRSECAKPPGPNFHPTCGRPAGQPFRRTDPSRLSRRRAARPAGRSDAPDLEDFLYLSIGFRRPRQNPYGAARWADRTERRTRTASAC